MAEEKTGKVLVIGMGNVLMQDEGIGVRAVEELVNRYRIPAGVEVVDGGTTGMELFEPMRRANSLIIADAVNTGAANGSLIRIANDEIPAFFQTKLSNHQLGVSDLLALLALKGETPEQVTIVGMVPHSLKNRLGLTPEAAKGLEAMVQMLVEELASLGIELESRPQVRSGHWKREAEFEAAAGLAS
ncbi:MAG: hydrogenase expression/formation protein [gamma proteobacterium symbiont of Ctena orbiculata]|uniref:HyaD/HybD family hydrogenase maturation endopeptidase n=1 Tax=Candidatus Thiodiazotropha taylori TaxID=2792791 RepID=A0A944M9J8_9GAMM|nr:HyaD/HybD family hydrogenase maturation endopeptidase [Candidatus Thiodiazotropha taylori]PUB88547.1 MAG: hydrogenase 2 maturation endopeptidase [gamma proteobacterium symbiont of Ctena orbiculata]MBT2989773.1 HyaD/HybD family hydrogenase maturation endopeptidase [Candidatus Thiodiazotropha taylori]MBT2995888.1 HyaD/HybD family hydrogenase maturation endopeptidase [Candidatus Thiodiazotropha taylori]MBT2999203.1 HyaD/HybD family hydrogenase maturation endopeptidase [Candidatus Thiodiazotroph